MVFERSADGQVSGTYLQHGAVLHLRADRRYIVNPGSVGQPRDGDPRAAYAVWDTSAGTVQFARIGYDIGATQKQIAAAGLPAELGERLAVGSRAPHSTRPGRSGRWRSDPVRNADQEPVLLRQRRSATRRAARFRSTHTNRFQQ